MILLIIFSLAHKCYQPKVLKTALKTSKNRKINYFISYLNY